MSRHSTVNPTICGSSCYGEKCRDKCRDNVATLGGVDCGFSVAGDGPQGCCPGATPVVPKSCEGGPDAKVSRHLSRHSESAICPDGSDNLCQPMPPTETGHGQFGGAHGTGCLAKNARSP